jgi:N-acetylglucosaminyl-diphospho-decaprenol L-rhamnosyltransferase
MVRCDFELVVVTYRSRPQVEQLFASLPGVPVVVVDNSAGVDGMADLVAARPGARYLDGGGRGFAHAANLGARSSRHDVVVFVNPDARPTLPVIEALVHDVATDPTCASSSAATAGPDGQSELGTAGWEPSVGRALAHAIAAHKVLPRAGLYARPRPGERLEVDWTSGACMAMRRETLLALGGWDEGFYVYSEDVALGRAVRERGLEQRLRTDLWVPHASGGSGAPSLEMMRLRGVSMASYVRRHHPPAAAGLIIATLALGYFVRGVQQGLGGDRHRSREHLAWAQGVLTGRAVVGGRAIVGGAGPACV